MKYVMIGAAFAGNKGAASMLEASIQTISERDQAAEITVLSMYPTEDRRLNTYPNATVLDARPRQLGPIINSLALAYRILPPLRPLLKKHKAIKAISEADVYLDQGGITFVDGREKFLIYNIASILPGLMMKVPVVKCAQAMGPFNGRINATAARMFLPRVNRIFSRGAKSHEYATSISADNVEPAADYAFSLKVTEEARATGKALFDEARVASASKHVGFFPSQVLRGKTENYDRLVAQSIDQILDENPDTAVYLMAHSQRERDEQLHNNDNPVCKSIFELIQNKDRTRLLLTYTSPTEMRALIGQLDMTVAARFHAMVSSLAMGVPTLVTTWSHKYLEVLEMFDCRDCAVVGADMSTSELAEAYAKFAAQHENYGKRIESNLGAVLQSSKSQADYIVELAKANS